MSQKAPPMDHELTHYWQCIPQRKNGEWCMVLSSNEKMQVPKNRTFIQLMKDSSDPLYLCCTWSLRIGMHR